MPPNTLSTAMAASGRESAAAVIRNRTLLLILPGNEGRKPVLEKLLELGKVIIVVFQNGRQDQWANELVEGRIEVPQGPGEETFHKSYSLIKCWIETNGKTIDGVMCYDEYGVELSAYLCEKFNVPGTPFETMMSFRNKDVFRKKCIDAGLCSIRCANIQSIEDVHEIIDDETWPFPAVLKPCKGAGSWHVKKVKDRHSLLETYQALNNEFENGYFPAAIKTAGFVLEEYFKGAEVDIDGWAENGKVSFQLVADNYPAVEPYFLEQGGNYPSQLSQDAIDELEQLTHKLLQVFPGVHGCFHFEAKINLQTMKMLPIEFNCRVGGAECPLSVEAVSGYYLPMVAGALALGFPAPQPATPKYKIVCSTNFYPPEKGILVEISHTVDAKKLKLVSLQLFKTSIGSVVEANNGSVSCLGWASAGGENFYEASANLKEVINNVQIRLADQIPQESEN